MLNYSQSFERIRDIMNLLREKCPWDKKQTIHTLRQLTIEETYELADAITKENWIELKEELGDLLLHIVFYAKIAEEENKFTIGDVINTVCDKLVFRHPHIYSHVKVSNEDDVKQNWEKLKLKAGRKSILAGVPDALPAMVKALRMQEKAKQVGFEWEATEQVKAKINEELDELEEAIASQNQHEIENEFGDVLFSLINYARYLGIDPENALSRTNNKFKSRFEKMELKLTQNGKSLTEYSLTEMDNTWNEIKKNET
jgi:MazG family protein